MEKKIILENKFTTHQKTHLILVLGGAVFVLIVKILSLGMYVKSLMFVSLLTVLFIILISIAFTKKGLTIINDELYRAVFLGEKLIIKKKISLQNKTKIATLKLRGVQKMAWFSDARPDMADTFNKFDIALLNNKHTEKDILISVTNEEKSEQAILFLEQNFKLNHEIYSPDFSEV